MTEQLLHQGDDNVVTFLILITHFLESSTIALLFLQLVLVTWPVDSFDEMVDSPR